MKKIVCFLFLSLLNLTIAFALTQVSGGIYKNTTWSLSQSPYLVSGSIVVFPGATLNIEPGVEVRIADGPLTAPGLYIEARGTINMIGTSSQPIKFCADSATQTVGAWQGFNVNNAQGGAINYDYVSISNANAAFIYSGTPPQDLVLHHCQFNFNYYAVQNALNLTLDSCSFFGNNSAISGWSNFTIKNCIFDSNGAALAVYASSVIVDSCTFTRNAMAINLSTIPFTGMSIKHCLFIENNAAITNPGNGSIQYCEFLNNIYGISSTVYAEITDCFFNGNFKAVQLGFGSKISKCQINGNAYGVGFGPIGAGQPPPTVENNKICNNDSFNIENNTDLNLFVASNCFCESDSAIIESKILDGYDDIARGLISYAIYDTSCTQTIQMVNKANPNMGVMPTAISEVKIYPNPSQGLIHISPIQSNTIMTLLNAAGKDVGIYKVNQGDNQFDFSLLPKGFYVIRLESLGVPKMVKLVLN